jgi:hypothetical protein
MSTSIPTASPTTFEAAYYGILAFSILGCAVLTLLCCGCVARSQNNHQAWLIQKKLLKERLRELQGNDKATADDYADLLAKTRHANEGGLMPDITDSLVTPLMGNDVSKDISSFFYHSTLGRFLLVSNQGLLNICCLVLSMTFSLLASSYINLHVIPSLGNQASGALNILVVVGVLLLVVTICRDQFGIFLQPRLGGTGIVERGDATGGMFMGLSSR